MCKCVCGGGGGDKGRAVVVVVVRGGLRGLVVGALLWLVPFALRVAGPEGEVVAQQLHYQRRVLVAVLVQCVELGDRVVERLERERGAQAQSSVNREIMGCTCGPRDGFLTIQSLGDFGFYSSELNFDWFFG